MIFLGIDPGLTGAVAWWWPAKERMRVLDIPSRPARKGRELDAKAFHQMLKAKSEHTVFAAIEVQKILPRQGVQVSQKTMTTFGQILMAVEALEIPYVTVQAQTWRKAVGLKSLKGVKDKDPSMLLAKRQFKSVGEYLTRKSDHDRAEAMLIAWYASMYYEQNPKEVALG